MATALTGEHPMKKLFVAFAFVLSSTTLALADDKPSADEATKITATATAWGCEGGTAEKETEGTGVFELNDAKCKDGNQYDLKLDKAFKVISITAD
jgi:hypothetical protein